MKTLTIDDDQHRRVLALVRNRHMIAALNDPHGMNPWDELLDVLEVDRPEQREEITAARKERV